MYWPTEAAHDDYGVATLEEAFASMGFTTCTDGGLETGYGKIALYGYGFFYTHVARQLPDGNWTSKLGKEEDIAHDTPDDVAGGIYGEVVQFMKRPI